jgi:hypothetical protein
VGKITRSLVRLLRLGEDAEFMESILGWFGLRPRDVVIGAIGGAIATVWSALQGASWLDRTLYGLVGLAAILTLIAAGRLVINVWRSEDARTDKKVEETSKEPAFEPQADIDAREAFFQIIEKSEWADQQLAPDPRTTRDGWLKTRLSTAIHNDLAQGKLSAWGETNMAQGTGPQRKINSEEWEKSEILFDDLNPAIPRTMAKWRNNDRASLHGIMFSRTQIFRLFPLRRTLSLQDAARRVFTELEDSPFGKIIMHRDQTENARLNLLITGLHVYVPLRGKRPPSTIARHIEKDEFRNLVWIEGTNDFRQIWSPHNVVFRDIEVTEKDLIKHIHWLKNLTDREVRLGEY